MIYDCQKDAFADNTVLNVDVYLPSKPGIKEKIGNFVINEYLDVSTIFDESNEGCFFTETCYFLEYGNDPGAGYYITKHENHVGRDQKIVSEQLYPLAYLHYDRQNGTAVIRLSYSENGADTRFIVFYGFTDKDELLQNISILTD